MMAYNYWCFSVGCGPQAGGCELVTLLDCCSWAPQNWHQSPLLNHPPSVLWHCWLGHL